MFMGLWVFYIAVIRFMYQEFYVLFCAWAFWFFMSKSKTCSPMELNLAPYGQEFFLKINVGIANTF
jgi:hypothetical protein